MDVAIDTITMYTGPGWTPNGVTRTSDGILYVMRGVHANQDLGTRPNAVYKSIDNGYTWIKDAEWVQAGRSAGNNTYAYGSIAVDGLDTVHAAWGSWSTPVTRHGYLSYATKLKGGSWSGVTDLTNYVTNSSVGNSVNSMVIDGLNQVHILYLVHTAANPYKFEHHWYDGSWHKEDVYGGDWNACAMLAVDPDNTLYQLYGVDSNIYLGKKPLGGSWSTEAIPVVSATYRFCCDKDGNLHFISTSQYKRRNSDTTWESAETYTPTFLSGPIVSVTQDGIVHIAGRPIDLYKYRHCQRSLLGVWSYIDLTDDGAGASQGNPLLHAIFPVVRTYYPCLLESGYAFPYLVSNNYLRFTADPEIPAPSLVYPSDSVARVSSIRHICRSGFYRMQVGLGDLGFDIDVAEATVRKALDTAKETEPIVSGCEEGATSGRGANKYTCIGGIWTRTPEAAAEPPTPPEPPAPERPSPPSYWGGGPVSQIPGVEEYRERQRQKEPEYEQIPGLPPMMRREVEKPSLWSRITPWREEAGETFGREVMERFETARKRIGGLFR